MAAGLCLKRHGKPDIQISDLEDNLMTCRTSSAETLIRLPPTTDHGLRATSAAGRCVIMAIRIVKLMPVSYDGGRTRSVGTSPLDDAWPRGSPRSASHDVVSRPVAVASGLES